MQRRAKSFSKVDHELLHGRFLHALSREALALYLFLVVVGDQEGKSFYRHRTIAEILRFSHREFYQALKELALMGLVRVEGRYIMVKNLT